MAILENDLLITSEVNEFNENFFFARRSKLLRQTKLISTIYDKRSNVQIMHLYN
jgi:hypothetical protein